ncbi:hypothetical protein COJ85_10800 [Bacillus sp. AFS076308]|uniref:hypothetical protein n=1 Tax=unclassified Bacillus (in: firmicutes) TaxID=185979 RepID=UPI000BF8F039|nr:MULTISPECIES: hypothetical protein [unclassified Bacillus (in: firmicutes)]PFO04746.1 hypothetical protein COJ85_10800 [Bacillus sp. AFS076308]PGV49812.1 hypothetical protein COD92_20780 [Bacillus sp. AFS037270]
MKKMTRQPFFKLFTPKPKSRMPLWASLVGLSLSAALFGITRGKRSDFALPFQNAVKNFSEKTKLPSLNVMDNTALTEFSEELMESALNNNKQ